MKKRCISSKNRNIKAPRKHTSLLEKNTLINKIRPKLFQVRIRPIFFLQKNLSNVLSVVIPACAMMSLHGKFCVSCLFVLYSVVENRDFFIHTCN